MFKILVVGDPHATVEELQDCEDLVRCVSDALVKFKPDMLLFLGDQHHNHAVVRVEVIDFWRRAYRTLGKLVPRIGALVGNHDRPGDASSTVTAMQAYEDLVTVYDKPHSIVVREGGVLLVPFQHDGNDFVATVNAKNPITVICHQTFAGSTYENGFYASDGVNTDLMPAPKHFISGHIHTPQEFRRVWYPGAPRWRIRSDANTDRNIWCLNFDDNGALVGKEPFSTRGYCRELVEAQDHEGQPVPDVGVPEKGILTVDIRGSQAYVDAAAMRWRAQGARFRTQVTQSQAPRVRESEGIGKALKTFLTGYKAKNGTDADTLLKMAEGRIRV